MRILFFIIFFFSVTSSGIGQKANDSDSLFYYRYFKINTSTNSAVNINSDYKVIGAHDNIYMKTFTFMLWFYKSFISEQLLTDCSFIPSCSRFSYQAIHDLGLIKGIFLTADRLTRCDGVADLEAPPYLIDHKYAKVKDIPSFYKFSK
jgi:putative component of membrane protein insertase Oxa1/YidC/SpoIIIJ protein YidD